MAKPDFGPITPIPSHARPTSMDAIRKAKSIGPAIKGSDVENEFRSPLNAKTIPDLMSQYGIGLQDNFDGGPTEAVTRFLGPTGIPNKLARKIATSKFMQEANKLDPQVGAAAEALANRYPRVAAHTRLSTVPVNSSVAAAQTHSRGNIVNLLRNTEPQRIPVEFSKLGLARSYDNVKNTLAHEMTHVAQVLGLGGENFSNLYTDAQNIIGYQYNPFERSARRRGMIEQLNLSKPEQRAVIKNPDSMSHIGDLQMPNAKVAQGLKVISDAQMQTNKPLISSFYANDIADPSRRQLSAQNIKQILDQRNLSNLDKK